jgi:hypothetical protein
MEKARKQMQVNRCQLMKEKIETIVLIKDYIEKE